MKTFVDFQSLAALEFVSHPVFVFDVDRHGIYWGNQAAIDLWRAKDLDDLCARDFSSDSKSVKDKTKAYYESGVTATEIWTFYPAGERETRVNNHRPCKIGPDGNRGLIIEVLPFEEGSDDQVNERLQMLQMMRYTNILVTMFDLNGQVICQNPIASTTYASALAKSENTNFLSRFVSEPEGRKFLRDAQAGRDIDAEIEMNTAKGPRTHSITIRAGTDPASGAKCFIMSEEDITVLAKALRAAENSNRTKSEFISMISHEVRTPIAGILGLTEIMLNSEDNEKSRENLKRIRNSGQHLIEIVNDLLDIAKLEAQGIVLQNKKTSLRGFITEFHSFWEPSIEEKGLSFRCDLSGDFDVDVMLDSSRLRQVLNNLVSNARKFTREGSISLKVKATEGADSQLNILFEVSDTGRGFSAKFANDIFEPFTQEGVTDEDEKGTGLGLRICSQLLELMGSSLKCKSSQGSGSSFWFEMTAPLHKQVAEKNSSMPQAPQTTSQSFAQISEGLKRPLQVLVVDDNETNRLVIEAFLLPTGASIHFATNGAAAVEFIESNQTDIVLMDAYMPIMDGLEATRCIRKMSSDKAEIPILALTASGLEKDSKNCLEAGMNGVLTKPVDRKKLYNEMLRWLQPK